MTDRADPLAPLRDLGTLGTDVPWPDADAERSAREHRLPRRPGGPSTPFGQFAALAEWLAGVQGQWPPRPPADIRLLVVTARHRAPDDGRTLDDVRRVAAAVTERELPAWTFADQAGIRVEVVDAGEVGAVDVEDAALTTDVIAAVDRGATTVDRLVDEGVDLLVLTEAAAGATTPAAAVVAVLTRAEPVSLAGRGSGIDDAGWAAKTAAIRDARARGQVHRAAIDELLASIGGTDLAVLVGMILQAAGRRTPVLLDGPSAVAAALVAREVTPRIMRWIRLAHAGTDLAERFAVQRMGLKPLLDLGLSGVGVTAGLGGLLAVEHVRTAARFADTALSLSRTEPAPSAPAADETSEPADRSEPTDPGGASDTDTNRETDTNRDAAPAGGSG